LLRSSTLSETLLPRRLVQELVLALRRMMIVLLLLMLMLLLLKVQLLQLLPPCPV